MGGALGLCVAVAPSGATTVDITTLGTGKGMNDTITYDNWSKGVFVGQLKIRVSDVKPPGDALFGYLEGKEIYTFCTDIFDTFGPGDDILVETLDKAPTDEPDMGTTRAALIGALYYMHWKDTDAGDTQAAAFQAAIWELAFEGDADFSGTFANSYLDASKNDAKGDGISKGFKVSSSGIYTTANTYLSEAWTAWKAGHVWSLYAAHADEFQDLILIPIPLPAPFALAGVGLLGVLAGRRKLARLVK